MEIYIYIFESDLVIIFLWEKKKTPPPFYKLLVFYRPFKFLNLFFFLNVLF